MTWSWTINDLPLLDQLTSPLFFSSFTSCQSFDKKAGVGPDVDPPDETSVSSEWSEIFYEPNFEILTGTDHQEEICERHQLAVFVSVFYFDNRDLPGYCFQAYLGAGEYASSFSDWKSSKIKSLCHLRSMSLVLLRAIRTILSTSWWTTEVKIWRQKQFIEIQLEITDRSFRYH